MGECISEEHGYHLGTPYRLVRLYGPEVAKPMGQYNPARE